MHILDGTVRADEVSSSTEGRDHKQARKGGGKEANKQNLLIWYHHYSLLVEELLCPSGAKNHMRSKKALGAHDGLRCAGGRLPSGVSLDPLYPFFKTRLTWIKDQGEDCNKVHMNYAKSGKQTPVGNRG